MKPNVNSKVQNVQSASVSDSTILGTYEGECADSTITNKNGLDITREVWENVFASDEYKEGLANGWYIGYLGHPDDPGCQDFQNACIVMRECHIDDNGKIYGKFDLINTPVGRIVKAFQDAGVVFGISVRGAGDIVDNSVDPDTFIFRGFDLVAFPAYPDAVPKFSQIAAASDVESQQKYKKICAAVNDNIRMVSSASTVSCIQTQFAKNSKLYDILEEKKQSLESCDDFLDITDQKLEAMTQLYLEACQQNRNLKMQNDSLRKELKANTITSQKTLKRVRSITSSQMNDLIESTDAKTTAVTAANRKLKQQAIESAKRLDEYKSTVEKDAATISLQSKKIKSQSKVISELQGKVSSLQEKIQSNSDENLKYKQRVQANEATISELQSELSRIQADSRKTVSELSKATERASNLDDVMASNQKLERLLTEYQSAYAGLYATAIGVNLDSIQASTSMSVKDIQKIVYQSSGAQNRQYFDDSANIDDLAEYDGADDANELITI